MTALQGAMRTATLQPARFGIGSAASLDALADVAGSARSSVVGELFKLEDAPVLSVLRERAGRAQVHLHGDSESIADGAFRIGADDGALVTGHGNKPIKLHTKGVVADHERAALATAAPVPGLRADDSVDFFATFDGDAARALESATAAAIIGRSDEVLRTARDAARAGIYFNDPAHGVRLLTPRLDRLVDDASDFLVVGSKRLDDMTMIRRLAGRQQDGVRVLVETGKHASPAQVQAARDLGLDVTHLGMEGRRLHGNFMIADGAEAYFGTSSLSERGLARETAKRPTREMGWFTNDAAAIDETFEAMSGLRESRIDDFLTAGG